jgi:hypothetical protein
MPGARSVIVGYRYTCRSTTDRPSFSCYYYGGAHGVDGTPIMSIGLGQRTMTVRSESVPTVTHQHGSYTTTFKR